MCSCSHSGTSSHPILSSDRQAPIQSSKRKLKGPRKRGHSIRRPPADWTVFSMPVPGNSTGLAQYNQGVEPDATRA